MVCYAVSYALPVPKISKTKAEQGKNKRKIRKERKETREDGESGETGKEADAGWPSVADWRGGNKEADPTNHRVHKSRVQNSTLRSVIGLMVLLQTPKRACGVNILTDCIIRSY